MNIVKGCKYGSLNMILVIIYKRGREIHVHKFLTVLSKPGLENRSREGTL